MVLGYRQDTGFLSPLKEDLSRPGSRRAYDRDGLLEVRPDRGPAALTDKRPVPVISSRFHGYRQASTVEDYYNRVYLLPGALDFGTISVKSRREFVIWNAWLKTVTLTAIFASEVEGTSLDGITPNRTYLPLALRRYMALVEEEGPASFDATYRFEFDTGEKPALILSGERARLLPFVPNWREPYVVTKDYRTEIITSRSGREQRRALRQTARKTIEFSAMGRGAQLRAFNRHMNVWQNRSVILGEEPKFARIALDVPEGNTVFEVEDVPEWALPGTPVFVQSDYDTASTEIKSVIGKTIVMEAIVGPPMPAGSYILKAVFGRIQDALTSTRHTAAVAETAIKVDVTPGTEVRPRVDPLPVSLDGRPVFLLRPNWKDAPQLTYLHPRETLDYDVGRLQVFTPVDFTTRRMSYLFSGRAEEDVRQIENLFDLVRGQAGEFYYPSYEHDLPFTSDLIAGTRSMEFAGSEMFDAYDGDTVHRAVMVLLEDDTTYVNSLIESPKFSDGKTIFTFRHDWPANVKAGTPKMVSWLFASRFATDKLTVEWLTRTVAQVKTVFMTLEDLPYEL